MSTSRNARTKNIPKTWEGAFKEGKDDAFDRAPNPQKRYEDIPVFPYGYTDPSPTFEHEQPPKSGAVPKSKPAKSKPAQSKPAKSKRVKSKLPKLKIPRIKRRMAVPLPNFAPRDYKRLQLEDDFLPVNASEWQLKNLFNQIHNHFGSIGAHVFETFGLQGILPTTRWPLSSVRNINDTYYIIRMRDTRKKDDMKDTRKKKDQKDYRPLKAFLEFLIEHKNNYCVAWRVLQKLSEFEIAKWCCFNDHRYLNEQEPFKGKVEITNYNSGYSFELNQVKVWTNFFKSFFDFLYALYANPRSNTTTAGKRFFQTFFVFICEGKRFPAIEKFNCTNMKKKLEPKYAALLPTPLHNVIHAWGNCSDLLLLLAIVMLEDELAIDLMATKPCNAKDSKMPHHSLVKLFEQFRRHRTKAEVRCGTYADDIKGLHKIFKLEKDEVSEKQKIASYGVAAFERLRDNCLNLVNFNLDLVLALKAREAGFQGLLEVDLAPEIEEKPAKKAKETESSSAAGDPPVFPQDTIKADRQPGFQGLLDVNPCSLEIQEKPAESSSSAAGGPSLFPHDTREADRLPGFQGHVDVDLCSLKIEEKPAEKMSNDSWTTLQSTPSSSKHSRG